MNYEYVPRNDLVLVREEGEHRVVQAVGPLVEDLRPGDRVVVMEPEVSDDDDDEGETSFVYPLNEDETLYLVREHFIMAIERPVGAQPKADVKSAYEDFHS